MTNILDKYIELNTSNYDDEDLMNLILWASQAYDEISILQYKLEIANKRLSKINDLAEEV